MGDDTMATKVTQADHEEALEQLRKWCPRGATVFTILRKVSRSGMRREIGVVVFRNGEPVHPNWAVATVLGRRVANDAVVCDGTGMDMGFDLVYSLARALYDDGRALTQRWL